MPQCPEIADINHYTWLIMKPIIKKQNCIYYCCMCVQDVCGCEHVYRGAHANGRGQTLGVSFLLPPFMWVLRIKLRPPGFHRKCLYPVLHHTISVLYWSEKRLAREEAGGVGGGGE